MREEMKFHKHFYHNSYAGRKETVLVAYGGKCHVDGCTAMQCVEKLFIEHDTMSIQEFKNEMHISDVNTYLISHNFTKWFHVVCLKHRRKVIKTRSIKLPVSLDHSKKSKFSGVLDYSKVS